MRSHHSKVSIDKSQIYRQNTLFDHLIGLCQDYLKNKKREKDIDRFLRSGNNINALMQRGRNGDSPLKMIIFIAFKNIKNPHEAQAKAIKLLDILFHYTGRLSSTQRRDLLCMRNNSGYSFLNEAIQKKGLKLIKFIFNKVKYELGRDSLEYKNLISTKTGENFTLLHDATKSGDKDIVEFVFKEAKECLGDNSLEYKELLIAKTKENFTLLFYMLTPENKELLKFISEEIKSIFGSNLYEYKDLLTTRTKGGFNLFHRAVAMDNTNSLNFLIQEFKEVFGRNSGDIIAELLNQRNDNGRIPHSGRNREINILLKTYRKGKEDIFTESEIDIFSGSLIEIKGKNAELGNAIKEFSAFFKEQLFIVKQTYRLLLDLYITKNFISENQRLSTKNNFKEATNKINDALYGNYNTRSISGIEQSRDAGSNNKRKEIKLDNEASSCEQPKQKNTGFILKPNKMKACTPKSA
ncbi:hypothetical protein I862_01745 [endosymbiont of Acanthamoeba sp. UWC8]|uniref:hypothetical protein n=1 Tax=endosymbiont of Acanthamoeba sp. UWC8 TaxID=86106 RepID=UPI0004D116FA|nr:hypothetical protein [endosymbiont of Acanthamoeba sp. UWC8]AIF80912.1 hypothetical protein I862_01745 [endosymbiont of Acanthamoeba sp. UWC8]